MKKYAWHTRASCSVFYALTLHKEEEEEEEEEAKRTGVGGLAFILRWSS